MNNQDRTIAIIGGLGKTGRRVAALMEQAGYSTRPLSRSTTPAFDWDQPDGWAAALDGTHAAYATFQPDLSVPHACEAISRLAAVARDAGLDQVVLLSGRGEDGALRAEQALAASGVRWTVVRASWFAQNFSESFLADAVRNGELVIPIGTAPEPFVDADDIAEVAAAALNGSIPTNRVYEVTGPEAIRFPQACAILSQSIGRHLTYREVPTEDFVAHLTATGVPDSLVPVLADLFTVTLDGRNARTVGGISAALGRPPRSFRDYARQAAESGAWPTLTEASL